MKIKSKASGEIEILKENIIHIEKGIIGFEGVKQYVLMDSSSPQSPFKWLQAVELADLAFVVIPVEKVQQPYNLSLTEEDMEDLDLKDTSDVKTLAIVVIPEDPMEMTANLQAPVILNPVNQKAKQIILSDSDYTIKHYIIKELTKELKC